MGPKIDKIKVFKRISREENKEYGRAGLHKDKREKRNRKLATEDYLYELELEKEEGEEKE